MYSEWHLEPIFGSRLVVLAIIAALVLLLSLISSYRQQSSRRRAILIGLRVLTILLVLAAMLRPTRISSSKKPQMATALILFDQSLSMTQSSAGKKSRWEDQVETLRRAEPLLQSLSKVLEIKIYGYDHQLHTVEFADGRIQFPEIPTGEQTDIGTTVYEAIQKELGKRLACVIVMGDGMQTAYDSQVEIHEPGRELDRQGVPLYSISFGRADDGQQSKDVAVEKMPQDYTTYVKTEMVVKGMIRIRGYVNQEIPVELEVTDKAGNKRKVDSTKVKVRRSGDLANVELRYTPEIKGEFLLTMRAELQEEESIKENNELSAFLKVREGGLKIVYLYGGSLLGEQQELRRTVNASPDMELDDQWVSIKGRSTWPLDWTKQFKDPSYDIFIIEDIPADAFSADSMKALTDAVDKGKGFMMIGGFHSFGPGNYYGTPIADMLPVTMGRFDRQDIDAVSQIREKLHIESNGNNLRLLPTGDHAITLLGPKDRNGQIWSQLPSLDGANRFSGLKSRARVLLESPGGDPLLASSDYGGGRVLAFAGNSTWKWRRRGYGQQLRRYWRQVILWLARRDNRDEDEVWIELSQRRLNPASPLIYSVGARNSVGEALDDVTFEVSLVPLQPAGSPRPLRVRFDGEEHTGTLDNLKQAGDYEVRVVAKRGDKLIGSNEAPFKVLDQKPEKTNPAADPEQLRRLANLTKQWNGRMLAPEELSGLLRELERQPPSVDIDVETKWQLGATEGTAWPLFLLLSLMLGSEWFLRKKWGLV